MTGMQGTVDVLLGAQWGDEGKGKVVDVVSPQYDIIARFQGGPNAGHTLIFDGQKHVLHTIPSGVFREGTINLIGNGVVIDPVIFMKEIRGLEAHGVDVTKNLLISRKAHLILPSHRALDAASEASKGEAKIGSTLKGIGPTYMDKTGRNGLRVGDLERPDLKARYQQLRSKHENLLRLYDTKPDLAQAEKEWFESVELIRKMQLVDSMYYLNNALLKGKNVLAEGAQGTMLDIDLGTYPFVTSSNTICAGACTGLGVSPKRIGRVIGIFKAYCTRVGSGPFPTELLDDVGENIRKAGNEFGSTTGRPRRCGWLDLPALRYAVLVNGITELAMMKADVLSNMGAIKVCVKYEVNGKTTDELPYDLDASIKPIWETMPGWGELSYEKSDDALDEFISMIEAYVGVPITTVSVGPDRKETMHRDRVNA